ncbi:hypothetical protein [Limosilactobacillus reuteri]|uniref:hypothetical protein n=1 Tax=Limosilactobacillus reuteri TaxID=1598 RepID=UPI00155A5D45|nr:hypothetical protein [Limosilactobacillus reuteri]
MYFSEKEKLVISEALQLLWDERGLDYLSLDDNGKYCDSDYPADADLANIINRLWNYF